MKIAFKGIFKRTFLNFLVVALLPLFFLSAVVYKTFVAVNLTETETVLHNVSRYAAYEIETSLYRHLSSIKTWAAISIPRIALSFNRPEGAARFLEDLALQTKEYDLIYLTDADGKVFAASIHNADGKLVQTSHILGVTLGETSCPKPRNLESKICVDQLPAPLNAVLGNRPVIQLSVPLRDEGGLLVGDIHAVVASSKLDSALQYIHDAYLAPAFPSSGISLVRKATGDIIASSRGRFSFDINNCAPVSIKVGINRVVFDLCCSLDKREMLGRLSKFKRYFFIILFLTLAATVVAAFHFSRAIAAPVLKLEAKTKNLVLTDFVPVYDINTCDELEDLNRAFNAMMVKMREYQARLLEGTKNEAMTQVATQVAHDIRSPLAALDSVFKNTASLPEGQRIMVRHAVNRIRDIANNLLNINREQSQTLPSGTGHPNAEGITEVRLISSILDPVITEKRLQFEPNPGINVDFELTQEAYGLFANIQPVEFKRLISNLVNNSVEAFEEGGIVNLRLTRENSHILITVSDNGKGIPPESLIKLGQRGETHGKPGGSGLGLFHARSTVESWDGSLAIASTQGKGTTVTIKLPAADAPAGFVSVLELAAGVPIVVLDDDTSIHQVWQGRFDSARVKESDIEAIHFSEPSPLREWVAKFPEKANRALYLFDYELLNYKETGLSLARELNIASRVILVTSRYEERGVIEESTRLGIRMIPKGLAGFVPVVIKSPPSGSKVAVLIDDDVLVHMTWKVAARSAGVALKPFKNPADFFAICETLPKDTPIYIDSDLGDGLKGEEIAKTIHEKGFAVIFLETGHQPDSFPNMPWIKEVISKEPPWSA